MSNRFFNNKILFNYSIYLIFTLETFHILFYMINPNNLAKSASITHFLEEIDITTFEVIFYEIKL